MFNKSTFIYCRYINQQNCRKCEVCDLWHSFRNTTDR